MDELVLEEGKREIGIQHFMTCVCSCCMVWHDMHSVGYISILYVYILTFSFTYIRTYIYIFFFSCFLKSVSIESIVLGGKVVLVMWYNITASVWN